MSGEDNLESNPNTMDLEDANNRIDFIQKTLYEASRQCKYRPVDTEKIETLLETFKKALDDYYKYLRDNDVDPQDSYITAWYYKEDGLETLEWIENFVDRMKSKSSSKSSE